MGRFDDRVVFVTGGAGAKGRSHALAFAREGADVAVFDLVAPSSSATGHDLPTPADLEATRNDVAATGRRCLVIQGDLRDAQQLDAALDRTIRELGRLDVIVARVGIFSLVQASRSDGSGSSDETVG